MCSEDFISGWDSTLQGIQGALAADSVEFSTRAEIALDLLEVSLDKLAEMGLLSAASVCVDAYSTAGKHIVQKYTLGTKTSKESGEETAYIKHFELVEDE